MKLSEIDVHSIGSEDKRNKLITTLYLDVKNRNGLGKALIHHTDEEFKNSSYYFELKGRLISIVSDIISKTAANHLPIDKACKQSEALLYSILAMIEFHPNDEAENIEFLKEFFNTSK